MLGFLKTGDATAVCSNRAVVSIIRDFFHRQYKAFFLSGNTDAESQLEKLIDLTVTVSLPGYAAESLSYASPFTGVTPATDKTEFKAVQKEKEADKDSGAAPKRLKKIYGLTKCPKCDGTGVYKKKGKEDRRCSRCFGDGEIVDEELAEQQKLADMDPAKRARLEKEADDDLFRGFASKRR